MEFIQDHEMRIDEIAALFTSAFTDSEGEAEGRLIGNLARNLLSDTPKDDLFVFLAVQDGEVVGAIAFTRLRYPQDERTVFLLAPVAVATGHQGKGVGQNLIRHGLEVLTAGGVDVAITYGDINFYARVGFAPIGEDIAKAPLPLQYPEGWLGQSLTSRTLEPVKGPSTCVHAFDNPEYW